MCVLYFISREGYKTHKMLMKLCCSNPRQTHFYGPTGLNAGVILMNVTRMKSFPGGWEAASMRAWDEYEDLLIYHDQDVLNIIFKEVSRL